EVRPEAGIWELFLPGVKAGACYKYHVESRFGGYKAAKADPYAFYSELRPGTASRVWDLDTYTWNDDNWMRSRPDSQLTRPMSVYEVHAGSWMRADGNRWLTWRELAAKLRDYVWEMGYTHVEFLP